MQNTLADKRQVILILRLTLDANGQLVHGEVAELEGKPIGRFVEWQKLPQVIQAALGLPQAQARDITSIELHEANMQSFIVKIWFEGPAEEADGTMWRGYVSHVSSGQRCDLTD